MPFKRGRIYYVQLKSLPGYGRFPETSTYVSNKQTARQMEDLLRQIAEKGLTDPSWHDLLDALRSGRTGKPAEITLPELLKAHNQKLLDDLRVMLRDPLLSDAIAEYESTDVGYDTSNGLRILLDIAEREFGPKIRFGVLKKGKNITLLCACAKREGGRKTKQASQWRTIRSSVRCISLVQSWWRST